MQKTASLRGAAGSFRSLCRLNKHVAFRRKSSLPPSRQRPLSPTAADADSLPVAVPLPRRAFPTVPPGEADALPAPIFPKKRRLFFRHSCLKKTHCSPTQYSLSRRIPARRSRKPCIFRKTLRGCRPFAVPLPRRAFPAVPPHNRVRRVSAPPLMLPEARLKNSRVGRCRSSAPAPVCPARAGGKSGKTPLTHFPMPQKPQKKDGPRKKRRPSECSAAETANTCRKPTCWASACSDKFHALRTCSLDTCPWSCRARCGRRGSDAPADRRWKDQRTDLRFHPA